MRRIDLSLAEWKDVFDNHQKFIVVADEMPSPAPGDILELVAHVGTRTISMHRLVTHVRSDSQVMFVESGGGAYFVSVRPLSKFEKENLKNG